MTKTIQEHRDIKIGYVIPTPSFKKTVKKIMEDAALRNVKAVQNQHFIIFKYRYKYSNSQHFGDAVTLIARGAYPELFEDAKDTSVKVQ